MNRPMTFALVACSLAASATAYADSDDGGAVGAMIGVRGSYLGLDGSDAPDDSYMGLSAKGLCTGMIVDEIATAKVSSEWHLGGGQANLEGRLRASMTFGLIHQLGDSHGPFFRLGMGGDIEGNDRYYFSFIELPLAEIGYHYSDDGFAFELGGRASPVLTARYFVGHDLERQVGTVGSWGGFASLYAGPVWINATFMRMEDHSPVNAAWGHLCFGMYGAVCIDAAVFNSRVERNIATTQYVGLSLGIGLGMAEGDL